VARIAALTYPTQLFKGTNMSEKITVTLTGRAPVRIKKDDWPVIASASWYSGQHECQANYKAYLKVRQHRDGRTLVYGAYTDGPGGSPLDFRDRYAGELLPGNHGPFEVEETIKRVAYDTLPDLAEQCIADLPAEEL
jgi:hypothetical protein